MSTARHDILQLADTGRVEDVMREMRVRALWSNYYFAKVVLGYDKLSPNFHLGICEEFIQRWLAGYLRQWLELPRAFYKTTTFTIGTSMWGVLPWNEDDVRFAVEHFNLPEDRVLARFALHDQDATQLIAFEIKDNAVKKVREIRWHYEENQLFRALFPEIAYIGKEDPWVNSNLKQRRKGYAQREEEGTFEAIGVGGALQSRHYLRMWLDDLVGKAARDSQTVMESTIEWFKLLYGAFTSAAAARQFRIGVSNRWGHSDLNSHVRQNQTDVVFYTRSAIELDPETGQDVAACPEILSLTDLAKLQAEMTRYDFACQYLNKPFRPGEEECTSDLLHRYTVSRDGLITCQCGYTTRASALFRVLHYDPYNARGQSSRSCPGLILVGCAANKHIFALEYFTHKGSYGQVFDKICSIFDRWHPHRMTYEDVAAQNMTEFYVKERRRKESKYCPPIFAMPTRGKGMEMRVRDYLLPIVRDGRLAVRADQQQLCEMFDTFPFPSFEHDYDLLDALAHGPARSSEGIIPWVFPLTEEEQDEVVSQQDIGRELLGVPYSTMEVYA